MVRRHISSSLAFWTGRLSSENCADAEMRSSPWSSGKDKRNFMVAWIINVRGGFLLLIVSTVGQSPQHCIGEMTTCRQQTELRCLKMRCLILGRGSIAVSGLEYL